MLNFELNGLTGTETEDILRCLKNLYSIPAGSIPCDRELGLSWAALDDLPAESESLYALELMQKTDRYEPRVIVTEVDFVRSRDGKVIVSVMLKRKES